MCLSPAREVGRPSHCCLLLQIKQHTICGRMRMRQEVFAAKSRLAILPPQLPVVCRLRGTVIGAVQTLDPDPDAPQCRSTVCSSTKKCSIWSFKPRFSATEAPGHPCSRALLLPSAQQLTLLYTTDSTADPHNGSRDCRADCRAEPWLD
jgi:hypothetical protein